MADSLSQALQDLQRKQTFAVETFKPGDSANALKAVELLNTNEIFELARKDSSLLHRYNDAVISWAVTFDRENTAAEHARYAESWIGLAIDQTLASKEPEEAKIRDIGSLQGQLSEANYKAMMASYEHGRASREIREIINLCRKIANRSFLTKEEAIALVKQGHVRAS